MRTPIARRKVVVMLAVLCVPSVAARARAQGSPIDGSPSRTVQGVIRVKSNLVIAPVWVFYKNRLGPLTSDEARCGLSEAVAFFRLTPTAPYLPDDCFQDEVRGRAARDFHLFDDGVEQKIQRVTAGAWRVPVRDNVGWHLAISDTSNEIWSSPELGHLFNPGEGLGFYSLAFQPADLGSGCRRIKVKVDHKGTRVFARSQYCANQSASNNLAGTATGEKLERDLASTDSGTIPLSVQAGAFSTGPGAARVDFVAGFPWERLNRHWDTATSSLRATIGIMGIVYSQDGAVAARFSDLLYPPWWPTFIRGFPQFVPQQPVGTPISPLDGLVEALLERWDWVLMPTRFETQLDLPPGKYTLRAVLSDGEKFGRAEVPLAIDNYGGKELALSSVMLCKRYRDAHVAAVEAAAANFAPQYVPLVSKGIRVDPAPDTRFKKGETLGTYFEVYEPDLAGKAASPVEAQARVANAKGDSVVKLFPPVHVTEKPQQRGGFWAIPVALKIPYEQFAKGNYRLEVHAMGAKGDTTPWRSADFTIE